MRPENGTCRWIHTPFVLGRPSSQHCSVRDHWVRVQAAIPGSRNTPRGARFNRRWAWENPLSGDHAVIPALVEPPCRRAGLTKVSVHRRCAGFTGMDETSFMPFGLGNGHDVVKLANLCSPFNLQSPVSASEHLALLTSTSACSLYLHGSSPLTALSRCFVPPHTTAYLVRALSP